MLTRDIYSPTTPLLQHVNCLSFFCVSSPSHVHMYTYVDCNPCEHTISIPFPLDILPCRFLLCCYSLCVYHWIRCPVFHWANVCMFYNISMNNLVHIIFSLFWTISWESPRRRKSQLKGLITSYTQMVWVPAWALTSWMISGQVSKLQCPLV